MLAAYPARPGVSLAQRGFLSVLVLNFWLVILVPLLYPPVLDGSSRALAGLIGPLLALLAYGVLLVRANGTPALRAGETWGLAVAVLWTVEVILTNLVFTSASSNDAMAYVTYGLLALLYLAAGWQGARSSERAQGGLIAGAWAGILSAPVAFAVALIVNYVAMDALLHHPLLLADMARAGLHDMKAFTLQDTLGGGLMHLTLLGPVAGALLGGLGGLLSGAGQRRRR